MPTTDRSPKTPVSIDDLGGGQGQDRTADLRFFRPSLSQLSYLAANCPLGGRLDLRG